MNRYPRGISKSRMGDILRELSLSLPQVPHPESTQTAPGSLFKGTEVSHVWFEDLDAGPVDDAP